ncbi:hypothetical protein [Methanofollis fontis]|uniref:Uncharacterized protein n=1 Tax=Methanofollis fontis TaxID=2052832 RepID=A0A483CU61_9EURY|nr:hypothetical protein [Methanofollis fontis]TAJ44993.1 hypothetical protein CUJ86_06870 [Methanofollis fontis]
MNEEIGSLRLGAGENLHILIGRERFRINRADLRPLLVHGHAVPVTTTLTEEMEDGTLITETEIVGHAGLNLSGRAVRIFTTSGCFIIPLVSFRRVARGEAVSAPLFPLVAEGYP